MNERDPNVVSVEVGYVGNREIMRDNVADTGLTWGKQDSGYPGTHTVSFQAAEKLLRHLNIWVRVADNVAVRTENLLVESKSDKGDGSDLFVVQNPKEFLKRTVPEIREENFQLYPHEAVLAYMEEERNGKHRVTVLDFLDQVYKGKVVGMNVDPHDGDMDSLSKNELDQKYSRALKDSPEEPAKEDQQPKAEQDNPEDDSGSMEVE